MGDDDEANLPPETADRFTEPFARFLKVKAATGGMLLLAACAALMVSNSAWSTPFLTFWDTPVGLHFGSLDFSRSLRQWINEGLMTLFFLAVALELKRSFSLGEFHDLYVAALSLAGALGGMLLPAGLYLLLLNGQPGMSGWGTVVATDTAFVVGILTLLGSRVPPGLHQFLPALCLERLSINAAGQVVYQLKNPFRDSTTHILFSPEDFIQRSGSGKCPKTQTPRRQPCRTARPTSPPFASG